MSFETYEVDLVAHVRITIGASSPEQARVFARKHIDLLIQHHTLNSSDFIVHKVGRGGLTIRDAHDSDFGGDA